MQSQLEDTAAKSRRLSSEAALLAESERFAEAMQRWEEALLFTEVASERAAIYEQIAQVLLVLARDFDAVQTAEKAVELRPDWSCAHLTLGRCRLNFGELHGGIAALRRAAELDPHDEETAAELKDAQRVLDEAE